ncbi:unnamed protein product [Closterium sp. Yama58-4]|nr:unnamed protein product [Closterium sp. Yama58-4]
MEGLNRPAGIAAALIPPVLAAVTECLPLVSAPSPHLPALACLHSALSALHSLLSLHPPSPATLLSPSTPLPSSSSSFPSSPSPLPLGFLPTNPAGGVGKRRRGVQGEGGKGALGAGGGDGEGGRGTGRGAVRGEARRRLLEGSRFVIRMSGGRGEGGGKGGGGGGKEGSKRKNGEREGERGRGDGEEAEEGGDEKGEEAEEEGEEAEEEEAREEAWVGRLYEFMQGAMEGKLLPAPTAAPILSRHVSESLIRRLLPLLPTLLHYAPSAARRASLLGSFSRLFSASPARSATRAACLDVMFGLLQQHAVGGDGGAGGKGLRGAEVEGGEETAKRKEGRQGGAGGAEGLPEKVVADWLTALPRLLWDIGASHPDTSLVGASTLQKQHERQDDRQNTSEAAAGPRGMRWLAGRAVEVVGAAHRRGTVGLAEYLGFLVSLLLSRTRAHSHRDITAAFQGRAEPKGELKGSPPSDLPRSKSEGSRRFLEDSSGLCREIWEREPAVGAVCAALVHVPVGDGGGGGGDMGGYAGALVDGAAVLDLVSQPLAAALSDPSTTPPCLYGIFRAVAACSRHAQLHPFPTPTGPIPVSATAAADSIEECGERAQPSPSPSSSPSPSASPSASALACAPSQARGTTQGEATTCVPPCLSALLPASLARFCCHLLQEHLSTLSASTPTSPVPTRASLLRACPWLVPALRLLALHPFLLAPFLHLLLLPSEKQEQGAGAGAGKAGSAGAESTGAEGARAEGARAEGARAEGARAEGAGAEGAVAGVQARAGVVCVAVLWGPLERPLVLLGAADRQRLTAGLAGLMESVQAEAGGGSSVGWCEALLSQARSRLALLYGCC